MLSIYVQALYHLSIDKTAQMTLKRKCRFAALLFSKFQAIVLLELENDLEQPSWRLYPC